MPNKKNAVIIEAVPSIIAQIILLRVGFASASSMAIAELNRLYNPPIVTPKSPHTII